jgi:hypothetical protein
MSRDAFSYDPQDAGDGRDASPHRPVRQHRPAPSDPNDGRNPAPEAPGRGDSTEAREQHPTRDERSDSPRAYYVRDRTYLLRDSEMHSLTEIGKFRVIAVSDLAKYAYDGNRARMEKDIRALARQSLVKDNTLEISQKKTLRVVTLTKAGHRVLKNTNQVADDQPIYHGLVKPREVKHDADLYRLYQKEVARIERGGGRPVRVLLDYELKRNLNRDLALLGPEKDDLDRKGEVAEKHGLQLVDRKIPVGSAGLPHWDDINQWVPEAPEWSPDSKVIRYRTRMSEREHWQVWGWDLSSRQRKQITHVAGDVESYSLASDGHTLILTVLKVRTTDASAKAYSPGVPFGGRLHPYQSIPILTQMTEAGEPSRECWVHDLRTHRERQATEEEIRKWKPGGQKRSEGSNEEEGQALAKYHVIKANESPDRADIAYIYVVDDPLVERVRSRRLLLRSKETHTFRVVTPDAYFVDQLWWNAEGTELYFTQRRGQGRSPELWRVGADGSNSAPVFKAAEGEYFSSFSPDKARRYFAGLLENNTSPPQVALLDAVTQQVRTLVDLNPNFKNLKRSPGERIEGMNRYGEPWFGYILKPLGYTAGIRYPLIVTTYRSGDYFLRGASGDQNPIQVYAANGFAVLSFDVGLIRNIRPGHVEDKIQDWTFPTASLESAVQELNNRGLIDPVRVGIAGFSHGEEVAGYAVLHTNLFRAAVGAVLYDPCFYLIGGTEWWDQFDDWGLGGWPQGKSKSNWQELDMPANADRIHTPILENASDTEFLTYMPLYRSLLDLGKPVDLYIYPNELHVRNQPKHRLEIYERNLDWFRFWLKKEEDPNPEKAEQYRRWKELRDGPMAAAHLSDIVTINFCWSQVRY